MKSWISVEAKFTSPPEDWSLFADAFTVHGCNSSLQSDDPPAIKGYLEDVPGARENAYALGSSLTLLGANDVVTERCPDEDWSEVWKAFFKPQRIGTRLVIVPSWENFDPLPDDLILNLDPGQAFGTGEHPTTRLCLRLLERLLNARPPAAEGKGGKGARVPDTPSGMEVLDLGCGSGILAIAAAKLGARPVTATDIEPSAVEIARANALANGVHVELFAGEGFGEWAPGRQWDVVVSNIISATLIRLAPEAFGFVREGGFWIVSGVLKSNWQDVKAAVESAGFKFSVIEEEDDWIGAVFKKTL
jgi:ribosomal protein L11 methyltransferase